MKRCSWAQTPLGVAYHDAEWGVPVHDDRVLFEFLILEGAQAGLSWETILRKREGYREAFAGFDPRKVSGFPKKENRLAAKAFLAVQKEFGSFDAYLWRFVGGRPIVNPRKSRPVRSAQSHALSKDLAKRGFRFVGSTIMYAYMRAVGMVNDHDADCFRR
jgi:DNA-3-methyladenine glycosylase I